MFTRPQLENKYRCRYPDSVSSLTQERRTTDISALQSLISAARDERPLAYSQLEEQLVIFTTKLGERIAIQYPGKESINRVADKICPYDFRPKILLPDGTMVKDMAFVDMWGVIEELAAGHRDFIKLLSAFFFRMGRMLLHEYVSESYQYAILNEENEVVEVGQRTLSWYKLVLEDEVLDSLLLHIPEIILNDGTVISFEAFIYFFEMLLQNEDSKYYYKKHNLTSGRIQTSDSMLLLSSYFLGETSLATLLQRYVSGFGVAKCPIPEIPQATGNLVQIVKPKELIKSFLDERNIPYSTSTTIRVAGYNLSVTFKIPGAKVAVISTQDNERIEMLQGDGWSVFVLEQLLDEGCFQSFASTFDR